MAMRVQLGVPFWMPLRVQLGVQMRATLRVPLRVPPRVPLGVPYGMPLLWETYGPLWVVLRVVSCVALRMHWPHAHLVK